MCFLYLFYLYFKVGANILEAIETRMENNLKQRLVLSQEIEPFTFCLWGGSGSNEYRMDIKIITGRVVEYANEHNLLLPILLIPQPATSTNPSSRL